MYLFELMVSTADLVHYWYNVGRSSGPEPTIRDARYQQYYGDTHGPSEVHQSKVTGVPNSRPLGPAGSGFGAAIDAGIVMLVNVHMFPAKTSGVEPWISMNRRPCRVDVVLPTYRGEGYGKRW